MLTEDQLDTIAFENFATSIESDSLIIQDMSEPPYFDMSDRNQLAHVFATEVDAATRGTAEHSITQLSPGTYRVRFDDYERVLDSIDWGKQTGGSANRAALERHGSSFVFYVADS